MIPPRMLEIVRQFPENGVKLLLHHPANVRDLLALTGFDLLDQLAFDQMTVDPTIYVASDYRHLASDLVLHVPLHVKGERARRRITLYILIEHQSEPDPLMILRLLDYLAQIFKGQVRDHQQRHVRPTDIRLQPILPVVFYTGTRRWDAVASLVDLVEWGERFRAVTPTFEPLFINLPALPATVLESAGGYFGCVLELVQQRHARAEEFQELLRRVARHLETMALAERLRWLELLSYIHALVYHERDASEHEGLREVITASVRTDEHRREAHTMGRTIAEALRDEGRQEGLLRGTVNALQQTLLLQLRGRFKKVPKATERVISATQDVAQLNTWLRRFATASSLEEVGIGTDD